MSKRAIEFAQLFAGGLSRRNFLGRAGTAAGIAAAACAGMLLGSGGAQAAPKKGGGSIPCKDSSICPPEKPICSHGHCHKVHKKKKL